MAHNLLLSSPAPLIAAPPRCAALRQDPRARRQVDLASRADAGRAGGRPHRDHRPCSKARTCSRPPRRMNALGAAASPIGDGRWIVDGVGVGGLAEPENLLDLGNSGTSARLLLGILATHPLTAFVTGDASLRRRPMGRVVAPLSRFGARFCHARGRPLAARRHRRGDPVPIELSAAGAVGAGQIGGAAGRAQHAGRHDRDRAAADPRPHRAHARAISAQRLRPSRSKAAGGASRSTAIPSSRRRRSRCRAIPPRPRSRWSRR